MCKNPKKILVAILSLKCLLFCIFWAWVLASSLCPLWKQETVFRTNSNLLMDMVLDSKSKECNIENQFYILDAYTCVMVWMRLTPMVSYIWMLVLSWWNYLGMLRRFGLVGRSTSWGWALRFQDPTPFPASSLSALCLWISCELSAPFPAPWLTCLLLCSHHDGHGL